MKWQMHKCKRNHLAKGFPLLLLLGIAIYLANFKCGQFRNYLVQIPPVLFISENFIWDERELWLITLLRFCKDTLGLKKNIIVVKATCTLIGFGRCDIFLNPNFHIKLCWECCDNSIPQLWRHIFFFVLNLQTVMVQLV